MDETKNTNKYIFLMIIAMLFWGFAWTAGKVAAEHSNAEVAAFWRDYTLYFSGSEVFRITASDLKGS